MCVYIISVVWFLGFVCYEESGVCGVCDWCSFVEDVVVFLIDELESEEENEERCFIIEEE